jgi:thiol-disulfide isomerase/thioredoxin
MNKQPIITLLLALAATMGQAKTYKTIKTPVAMACVNVSNGELKAREVIMRDTATTVHFTMEYEKGEHFRFAKDSYLMDEDGNRYLLRSAEGIALDAWVQSPESGVTNFTMHFEPMPKKVQVFDFIEGDGNRAFMLLGIHDKKKKLKVPTMEELSATNPYSVPSDWLKTDSITIRGRIEGYDAVQFGFTSMECYFQDIFEKEDATLVLDIDDDGTFYKKFLSSYPVCQRFYTMESKVDFSEMFFYARPGETVDITVQKNADGHYECVYHNGSSHEVERWLKSKLMTNYLSYPLALFNGSFSDATALAEEVWQNMLYRIDMVSRRDHFTPLEVQLALSDAQVYLTTALLDYARNKKYNVRKQADGVYSDEIVDSVNWKALNDAKRYTPLHHIDFDNPLMMLNNQFPFLVNRVQYAQPAMQAYFGTVGQNQLINYYAIMREMLGSKDNTLMAQLCVYQQMLTEFRNIPTVESKYTTVSNTFTHPYVKAKADEFYHRTMAQTELSAPLPDMPMTELIRSLCAKYPGRILIIDFWGMGCGPCRGAIQASKELRAEIGKRDDVKLVFIAGERTTEGSDAYKKYVAEWLADEETVCVTNTDFTRLQELFRFNGIPHYETITPDCRRVRDDLRIDGYDNFDYELERLKEKLK